jgi:integrase
LEWCKAHLRPRSYERAITSSIALKAYFGGKLLSKISTFTIEAYKLDRKTACECVTRTKPKQPSQRCAECKHLLAGKSNATINRELAFLKSLFYRAVEWKFVRETPMKRVKLFTEGRGRTRFLTPEEAAGLLAACNEEFRDVILIALHSGCRKSEITSLAWPNVDLEQRTFTVQACYAKNGETKTLPMTDEVYAMLTRRRADRDNTPGDLVFVSRYNRPWKSWSTAWENACERAGLKDFRFHDLRHCFGSWLAMNGTAPKAMMELMGHKTASMTMRYSHLSVEYKRQAVAKLPELGKLETKGPQKAPQAGKAKVVRFGKK